MSQAVLARSPKNTKYNPKSLYTARWNSAIELTFKSFNPATSMENIQSSVIVQSKYICTTKCQRVFFLLVVEKLAPSRRRDFMKLPPLCCLLFRFHFLFTETPNFSINLTFLPFFFSRPPFSLLSSSLFYQYSLYNTSINNYTNFLVSLLSSSLLSSLIFNYTLHQFYYNS